MEREKRRILKNLQYLERKQMEKIVDLSGRPVSQQQPQFNPVIGYMMPLMAQAVTAMLNQPPQNRPGNANTPHQIVESAWEIVKLSFAKFVPEEPKE